MYCPNCKQEYDGKFCPDAGMSASSKSMSSSAHSGKSFFLIPEGVTKIGEYVFSGCTGLTSVVIPGGLGEIKNFTFSECTGFFMCPPMIVFMGK